MILGYFHQSQIVGMLLCSLQDFDETSRGLYLVF